MTDHSAAWNSLLLLSPLIVKEFVQSQHYKVPCLHFHAYQLFHMSQEVGLQSAELSVAPASMNHFYLLPLIESLIKTLIKLTDINIRLVHFRSNKNFLLYLPPPPLKLRQCGWCILQAPHGELYSLKLCRGFRCETAKYPCLLAHYLVHDFVL